MKSRRKCLTQYLYPLLAATLSIGACSVQEPRNTGLTEIVRNSPWTLKNTWIVRDIFESPESALYDSERETIYISNVNSYQRNGLGYLSALRPDGTVIMNRWIDGLNAPTGMAINGDTLYVVDFDRVAEIDIQTRSIRQFHNAPDDDPGLNDITISPTGDIFVSASSLGAIYKLQTDGLSLWRFGSELAWANGLYADDSHLYVAGYFLRRIDLESKKIERIGDDKLLEDLETIEPDGAGGFFVTLIGARPIMHLSEDGRITTVLSRPVYTADIDFAQDINLMIAPSGEESVYGFYAQRD